ncbi:uncharacterized protein [Dermacentor albipictus]|uniref:uncharacterized protein n=1 Tax=Dermacentor albipictus TaxID=60249 RepID=UPI0038FC6AC7
MNAVHAVADSGEFVPVQSVGSVASPAAVGTAAVSSPKRHRHHRKRGGKPQDKAMTPQPADNDVAGSSGQNAYKPLSSVSSLASPEPESYGRHTGSEQRLIDRSQARHTTLETNSGPSSSSEAPQYVLLVGAVVTLVLVIVVNLSLDYRQPASPGRLRFPSCTSETCRHYAQLFTDSMNLSVSACDNFYAHVCGRWDSSRVHTGEESTLVESWKRLARRVGSRLSLVQVPSQNLEPIHRAARYIRTCLAVLEKPSIQEIKSVLDAGGITWPLRNRRPDFLNALFYMATRVFRPVFFNIETLAENPESSPSADHLTLFFGPFRPFQENLNALLKLLKAGELRDHLRLTYEMLNGSADEMRLKELAGYYETASHFFERYQTPSKYLSRSENVCFFLQYTKSVSKSRWKVLMKRYLNATICDGSGNVSHGSSSKMLGGVVIESADYFAALFQMHATYGEQVMNDMIEGLCVQNLVEYASFELLASQRGSRALATQVVYNRCFSETYAFYERAVIAHLHQPLSTEATDLGNVATDVSNALANALHENRSSLAGGNHSYVGSRGNFHFACLALDMLDPNSFAEHYEKYPVPTDNALVNSMQHRAFFKLDRPMAAGGHNNASKNRGSTTMASFSSSVDDEAIGDPRRAAGRFRHFRFALPHFEDPFYVTNVSYGVLMAGVGTRMAAALFYDLVDDDEVYAAKYQECLLPGTSSHRESGSLDLEILGAVASIGIAWSALQSKVPSNETGGVAGDVAFLKRNEVFFVFFCYLLCGDEDGERMCNLPLQNSAAFSRVFGCKEGALMNPTNKCRIVK